MLFFKKSVETRKIEKYVKLWHVRLKRRKKQAKIDVAFMFKTTTMQPQEAKEKYPTS